MITVALESHDQRALYMATTFPPIDLHVPPNFVVDVHSVLTGEDFDQLVRDNPELRMELTTTGELILMSPTGSKTGLRNAELNRQLGNWARANRSGVVFDSSTLFVLPNGARRSPDVSWVKRERWMRSRRRNRRVLRPFVQTF